MTTLTVHTTVIGATLARYYFAVLLAHLKSELAKPENRRSITIRYGVLVERAKSQFNESPYIDAAIPTNIGSRLFVVQRICEQLRLPNLACLGVNASGEPGFAYTAVRDWELDKEAVLAFDWDSVSGNVANAFESTAQEATQRAQMLARRKKSESEARDLLWEESKANPGVYIVDLYQKEAMIKLIMDGFTVADAYAAVTE